MLTQDYVKSIFNYNEITGVLKWRVNRHRVFKGKTCNSLDRDGYKRVTVDGKGYRVHRIIWLYVYGYMPENQIDHKDQVKTNNKIENLREVSFSCSSQNRDNFKSNTSGVKGISWNNNNKKWKVTIMNDCKNIHGGYFSFFDEAVAMRLAMEQCLNYNGCYLNTPAYRYIYGK